MICVLASIGVLVVTRRYERRARRRAGGAAVRARAVLPLPPPATKCIFRRCVAYCSPTAYNMARLSYSTANMPPRRPRWR
jgi:hypothetical protein